MNIHANDVIIKHRQLLKLLGIISSFIFVIPWVVLIDQIQPDIATNIAEHESSNHTQLQHKQSSDNTNYFSSNFINRLIHRSKEYPIVHNISRIENRYYRDFSGPAESVVDNDISDNSSWQYQKGPLASRMTNLQSCIPLNCFRNQNSVDNASYALTLPMKIRNNQLNKPPSCSFQFKNFNPYPIFNNGRIQTVDGEFPLRGNTVFYFDSELDSDSVNNMVTTKTTLSGLYIFCTPTVITIFSYITAYGGAIEQKTPNLNKNTVYPNIYKTVSDESGNIAPYKDQSFTFLISFRKPTAGFDHDLRLIIGAYLKQNQIFSGSIEDGYSIKASTPNYDDEASLFASFRSLFSPENFKKKMFANESPLVSEFNGFFVLTSQLPRLSPIKSVNNSGTHNFEYRTFHNDQSIKWRDYVQKYTQFTGLNTSHDRYYSRLYLVNQSRYNQQGENEHWWQPYIVNTSNLDGTKLLSDSFALWLQSPSNFDFNDGNPFDYPVMLSRSNLLRRWIFSMIWADTVLVLVVIFLLLWLRLRYRYRVNNKIFRLHLEG